MLKNIPRIALKRQTTSVKVLRVRNHRNSGHLVRHMNFVYIDFKSSIFLDDSAGTDLLPCINRFLGE